jgi:GLPGLI family protein
MKNKAILIVILFTKYFLYSQESNFEVTYSVAVSFDKEFLSGMRKELRNKFIEAQTNSETIYPKLIFNDTISSFYLEESMNIGNNNKNSFTKMLIGCSKPVFTNLKDKIIYFNNPDDGRLYKNDEFLIYKKIIKNWTITKETKLINGYLCYKAYRKENDFDVTAWFCPKFPYSYGPKESSGLPGLVFELNEKNTTFGLKSIKKITKKINITTKGLRTSYEEFLIILKERRKKRDAFLRESEK